MLRRVASAFKKQAKAAVTTIFEHQQSKKQRFFHKASQTVYKHRTAFASYFLIATAGGLAYVLLSNDNSLADEKQQPHGDAKKKVVVLGAGWGALALLQDLDTKQYDVTVISPRNYFLFTPLLASAVVGTVDVKSLIEPIRKYCQRINTSSQYYEASCVDIDPVRKVVICKDTEHKRVKDKVSQDTFEVPFDKLVVAVGSVNNTFGVPGVQEHCNFLREVEDATKLKIKVLDMFEAANLPQQSDDERKRLLHFVVIGGGPNGAEIAGELNDYFRDDMSKWYPHLMKHVQITMVECMDHILNCFDAKISEYAEKTFKRSNIDVRLNTAVTQVTSTDVVTKPFVKGKPEGDEIKIPFGICIWSTGVGINPLAQKLRERLPPNVQNNRRAVVTNGFLEVQGAKDIYALGDCATVNHDRLLHKMMEFIELYDKDNDGFLSREEFERMVVTELPKYPQLEEYAKRIEGLFDEYDINRDNKLSREEFQQMLQRVDSKMKNYPAIAQVAAQQGTYLAKQFNDEAQGKRVDLPFRYHHFGSFAYIGAERAVGEVSSWGEKLSLTGYGSWWLWRSVYLSKQVSYKNMMMVASDWTRTSIFGRDIIRQ